MKKISIPHSKKKIFEAVKKAAKKLGLEVRTSSVHDGKLLLNSDGGFFSFGNKIEILIKDSKSQKSVLHVDSKSAAAIQVIDWGTNTNFENEIIEEVVNILSQ